MGIYESLFLFVISSESSQSQKDINRACEGNGRRTQVVRESVETLLEMLSEDGVLRTTFTSSYEKSRFKDNFRSGHPYAEIGLEPDHRKDTAIWCELTFWAVEFLSIIESFK